MSKTLFNIGYGFKALSLQIELEFNHNVKLEDSFLSAILNVCLYIFRFKGIDYLTYYYLKLPKNNAISITIEEDTSRPSIEWMKLYYEIRKHILKYLPRKIEGKIRLNKEENIHLINNLWSFPTLGYNGELSELEDYDCKFLDNVGLYKLLNKSYCKLYSEKRKILPISYCISTKLEFLEELHSCYLIGELEEIYPIVPVPIKYLKRDYELVNKSKNDIIVSSIMYKDLSLIDLIRTPDLETNILIEKTKKNIDVLHKKIINKNIYVRLDTYDSNLISKYINVDLYEIFSEVT